ncbi:DUF6284 family protein [Micromonospora sp. KC721]|uniref:DUF6284 family protein n=1 Tax=Micromonospora sp. KC721 TaxID=2530380 RepID=UPI00104F5DC8|nr:DUF6284 family protein [Micromonospora sp. KC721]TDB78410.1 hypothetical protein E1182_15785 [Micromonospora sp. KC721]
MACIEDFPVSGPTAADLAAIEHEMPLIEAEVLLLDAQIAILCAEPAPSDLDWQRVRRAQRQVMRQARALLAARPSSDRAA